jgi:hypothetical protein
VTLVEALGAADPTIGSLTDAALRADSIGVDNVVTTGTVVLAASAPSRSPGSTPAPTVTRAPCDAGPTAAVPFRISRLPPWRGQHGGGSISFNSLGDFAIGTVGGVVGHSNSGGIGINQTGGAAGNLTHQQSRGSPAPATCFSKRSGPGAMLTSNAAVAAG